MSSIDRQQQVRGSSSAVFVAILLLIAGFMDVLYGIAALGDSKFFAGDTVYVFAGLHTWGWLSIALGVIELSGSISLFSGNVYGRVVGIVAASVGALGALANVGGAHPWWAIGVFAICIICIHGLVVYEEPERRPR
jgi:hypothetical protein